MLCNVKLANPVYPNKILNNNNVQYKDQIGNLVYNDFKLVITLNQCKFGRPI